MPAHQSIHAMKTSLIISITLLGGLLHAADGSPKDEITAAAGQLAESSSYSWHTATVVPEGTEFRPGPIDGKTEKDGFTLITWNFFDNDVQIVRKGGKAAYTDRDGAWQLAEEQATDEPGRWMSLFARNLPVPAEQATEIAGNVQEFTAAEGVYSGELTEEGAKTLMTFSRGTDGPSVSGAKGSAKFWLKDGALTKYQYHVKGLMDWGGNQFDVDRDTTVEVKEVGSTKIEVPEPAKAKLGT
jgi:hypothetical protein